MLAVLTLELAVPSPRRTGTLVMPELKGLARLVGPMTYAKV